MQKDIADMTLEELRIERERLINEDANLVKIREVDEQIQLAKQVKTMCLREWIDDNEK